MDKPRSIAVRFKCSKCGTWSPQRIQVEHLKAFKEKVTNKTIKCYGCKNS